MTDFIIRSGGTATDLHHVWFGLAGDFCFFYSGADQTLGRDAVDPSGDAGDHMNVSTDALSRLRSPSVMEVKEKGYEKLKEELVKAQRVRHS